MTANGATQIYPRTEAKIPLLGAMLPKYALNEFFPA
jgi:hypothetical protein